MTLPIHTVKHVKSSYRKIQIITICFTVITLAAALLAAVSGIQLVSLQEQEKAEAEKIKPATPAPTVNATLSKKIEDLKSELEQEKAASKKLKIKIANLNKQLSVIKESMTAPAASKPVQTMPSPTQSTTPSSTPAKPEPVPSAMPTDTSQSRESNNQKTAGKSAPGTPSQATGRTTAPSDSTQKPAPAPPAPAASETVSPQPLVPGQQKSPSTDQKPGSSQEIRDSQSENPGTTEPPSQEIPPASMPDTPEKSTTQPGEPISEEVISTPKP